MGPLSGAEQTSQSLNRPRLDFISFTISDKVIMCKTAASKQAKTGGNSEEMVNVGLLNVSSNSMSWLSVETVMEVASLIILFVLVLRWLNKFRQKKMAEKMRRISELITPRPMQSRQTSFIQELPQNTVQEFPTVFAQPAIMHAVPSTTNSSPKGLAKYRI